MIESLRGLGYSTATAIADIIDNSITADAKNINVVFDWKGENSNITLCDDGRGMSDSDLEQAMRLGGKNPLCTRDNNDLGRFGLGLKTASFSQCRRLTVASKKQNKTSCMRWDIDELIKNDKDGWFLIDGPCEGSEMLLRQLDNMDSGTLVIWEKLDRVVTEGFKEQEFLNLIDSIESHLSMVFHRYLTNDTAGITININGKAIKPWDPFLLEHPSTSSSPVVQLSYSGSPVEVQCHVLPHKDKLEARQYEIAGGPNGWTAQQGFYVYRNKRLLLAGSWLGLGYRRSWTKEEAHKLARLRIDISNQSDFHWKIDIRKSTARPPVPIRAQLTRLAEDTRSRARKVFAYRGRPIRLPNSQQVIQAWRCEHTKDGIKYRVDKDHPVVRSVLDDAGPISPQIFAMIRILEETLPVQRIWLSTAESKEVPTSGFEGSVVSEVKAILKIMYKNLTERTGLSSELAKDRLLHTEPFDNYPDLIAELTND